MSSTEFQTDAQAVPASDPNNVRRDECSQLRTHRQQDMAADAGHNIVTQQQRTSRLPVRISSSVMGSRHCCGMLKRSRSDGRTPSHWVHSSLKLLKRFRHASCDTLRVRLSATQCSQACDHATVCRVSGTGRTLMSGVVRLELSYDMFIDPAARREQSFSACRDTCRDTT